MRLVRFVVFVCILSAGLPASARATPENDIRNVLEQQVAAWNRGDLRQFVFSYAERCTLVGSTISETTREQVLKHYNQKYPSRTAQGELNFSGLTVHQIDARVAVVTGHWHLDRQATAGGSVGGVFSLVFQLINGSWQIVLDHTS